MTKTAMKFAELKHEKDLQKAKLAHEASEGTKNRRAQIASSVVSAAGNVIGSGIKAGGTIGGKLIGTAAKNDVAWYKKYTAAVGTVFNHPTFTKLFDTSGIGRSSRIDTNTNTIVGHPGLIIYKYIPCVGNQIRTKLYDTPMLWSMNYVMSKMRELNSRTGDYEPLDIFMLFWCTVEIYSELAELKRLVGLSNYFDAVNTDISTYYLKALAPYTASTYEDVKNDIKTILPRLNQMIQDVNLNLPIPKDFDLLNRRVWMNSHVFADSSLRMRQLILFQTDLSAAFNVTDGECQYSKKSNFAINVYLNRIQTMINNLKEEPTFITIHADMRAAYKEFYQMELCASDYVVEVHDIEEVREQLHNVKTAMDNSHFVTGSANLRINRTNGYVYQGIAESLNPMTRGIAFEHDYLTSSISDITRAVVTDWFNKTNISCFSNDIGEDQMLIDTRLQFTIAVEPVSVQGQRTSGRCFVQSAGTEVIEKIVALSTQPDINDKYALNEYQNMLWDGGDYNNVPKILDYRAYLEVDWCPIISIMDDDGYTPGLGDYYLIGDCGNIFHINEEDLSNIHNAAVISEYMTAPISALPKYSRK